MKNPSSKSRAHRDKIPVFLLTGFLGSGKSTLLNHVLQQRDFGDTAVIINEFGDVALDHNLVRVGETRITRATTGCLCCTMGSDVRSTLHELLATADSGEITFDRVIIETTGLADPAPIVNQLLPGGVAAFGLADHIVARNFELAGVITLVDVLTAELTIENQFEASKQIAFADRLVLTKTDLARETAKQKDIARLRVQLGALNSSVPIIDWRDNDFDPAKLFLPRPYRPVDLGDDVTSWLALESAIASEESDPVNMDSDKAGIARHGARIRTFAIVREQPVDAAAFLQFLKLLTDSAGPSLLRVKGIVSLEEEPDRPRIVHAVQHVVYPHSVLDHWPDDDHRTRLVFITDGVEPDPVKQLFEASLSSQSPLVERALTMIKTGMTKVFRSGAIQMVRVWKF
ncbi:GTP-binding protein [Hoeflea sp. WL0058]|uniref:GTP-binding protein n=1 Tax=Flavimaribacter sediminis TaxID=2865987 RepID=A0AAE3CZJ3_9HYPH|nr:GTP-binding protein [Flavimaribacter sediminis]MBW8636699.1 GTP-binding protein [Flavimaribacter sediminis]